MKISLAPTLELEFELLNAGLQFVAGVDEVGRGALAGPVSVGVCVVDLSVTSIPNKLRDSKLISKAVRQQLIPILLEWSVASSVGHATPQEIDEHGIVAALRLAWQRAFADLKIKPDHVILDGKHNWLLNASDLFKGAPAEVSATMKIKADQYCASVSAASVLAKVERDNLMIDADQEFPDYGFAGNVGYGSAQHMDAIRKHGATSFHRRSWNLPT